MTAERRPPISLATDALHRRIVTVVGRDASLDPNFGSLMGRVIATDRVGLLLGVDDAEGDEVANFIPWTSIQLIEIGFADEISISPQEAMGA